MLVSDSQPFGINYAAFDQSSSLYVLAKIYDETNGGAFVTQVPLTHRANGMYVGTFAGVGGKTYSIVTLVFTDPGYTTVDPNRSPGADTYQCVDFAAISQSTTVGIKVLRGEVLTPPQLIGVVITPPILRGRVFCQGG